MRPSLLRLVVVGLLAVFCVGGVAGQSSSPLLEYDWDGSCPVSDVSGNGNDGSCFGGVTTGEPGIINNSYLFDGSSGYIDSGSSITDFSGSNSFTVIAWFKTTSSATHEDAPRRIVSSGLANGFYMRLDDGSTGSEAGGLVWKIDDGSNDAFFGSNVAVNNSNWHMGSLVVDASSNELRGYINGSLEGSASQSVGDLNDCVIYSVVVQSCSQDGNGFWNGNLDESVIYPEALSQSEIESIYQSDLNSPPVFDNVESSPMSWTIGSNVSVSANVSASDGTVSSVSASVWENGSQIVSGQALTQGQSGEWTVSDLFTVAESDVFYNYSLTATDDDGAAATYNDSQFIKNEAPEFNISDLENKTYFSYDNSWTVNVQEDGDNVQDEEISCSTYLDGNQSSSFSGTEAFSESGVEAADLGSHSFKVSCSDPAGNTRNKTVDYTVKAFEISSSGSQASVFETESILFDTDFTQGSMVENVTLDLSWNGSVVNSTTVQESNGVLSLSETLYHTIPLSYSDGENISWRFEASVDYQGFAGNSSSMSFDGALNSQTVDWAYSLENSTMDPVDGDYIEGEDLVHKVTLGKELENAEIRGETTYFRDGEAVDMAVVENDSGSVTLQGVTGVGRADGFNESSFDVRSTVTLSFGQRSREIVPENESIDVHRIRLTDDGSEPDTAETLVFDSDYEGTAGQDIETDLFMDLSVSANGIERKYSYVSEGKMEHDFFIRPSWAEYEIRTDESDLIQYEKSDGTGVLRSYFFPVGQMISSEVLTVPLLNINRSETTRIDFEITRSSGAPAAGVICRVDRKFPGLGTYETVFMIKTGSEGNTESFAQVNEIYYRFTCYEDGEVVSEISDTIMQNPMRLTLGEETRETTLSYDEQFDADCVNNNTHVECSYQSSSDSLRRAVLSVDRLEAVKDVEVCRVESASRTGGLICSGLNVSEHTYEYSVEGIYPGGEAPGITETIGENTEAVYGFMGLLLTAIIYIFLYVAAAKHMLIGIGTGTAWILVSSMLQFFPLTAEIRASLVALVLVIAAVSQK